MTCDLLPDTIPTPDPIVACANVMGEEMNRAIMNIAPVQALSHPYTCPIPTGIERKSCFNKKERNMKIY